MTLHSFLQKPLSGTTYNLRTLSLPTLLAPIFLVLMVVSAKAVK